MRVKFVSVDAYGDLIGGNKVIELRPTDGEGSSNSKDRGPSQSLVNEVSGHNNTIATTNHRAKVRMTGARSRAGCRLLALSGRSKLASVCPLMTQSGHQSVPIGGWGGTPLV
jgi:hypothetical protein